MAYLQKATVISGVPERVFSKHATLAGLKQILAGILDIEFIGQPIETLFKGQQIDLYLGFKGISRRCLLKVEDVIPNQRIEIRQMKGLFRSFRMLTTFAPHGETGTVMTDLADYRLPLGLLGHLVDDLFLKDELEKLLANRHKKLAEIFENN
jgi:hypothetical protein